MPRPPQIDPPRHHSFRVPSKVWEAFLMRSSWEGMPPSRAVAQLVTAFAHGHVSLPDDSTGTE